LQARKKNSSGGNGLFRRWQQLHPLPRACVVPANCGYLWGQGLRGDANANAHAVWRCFASFLSSRKLASTAISGCLIFKHRAASRTRQRFLALRRWLSTALPTGSRENSGDL
jgi:hypothetical protein